MIACVWSLFDDCFCENAPLDQPALEQVIKGITLMITVHARVVGDRSLNCHINLLAYSYALGYRSFDCF